MKLSESIHHMHFVWYRGRPRRIKTLVAQLEADLLDANQDKMANYEAAKKLDAENESLRLDRNLYDKGWDKVLAENASLKRATDTLSVEDVRKMVIISDDDWVKATLRAYADTLESK